MDRGRAEAHLRQLAEAELRRATAPGARRLGHSGRLSLVAQALDLRSAPGEPATRIHLDPQVPAPDITVTNTATSPGEVLADVIAARVLALASTLPQETPGNWLPPSQGYSPMSPAGSVTSLPHWRRPAPAPGSWSATAAELPELDGGARVAVLGLHHSERGTILHLHAGGVTMEDDWEYYRAVRPLPALWIRDSADRWHATRDYASMPPGDNGEVTLELEIVPPLEAGTRWIDVVAAGPSAQVRARLPVRWTWNP